MGRKAQIAIVAVVVLLLGGSVAAYAVDAAQKDKIADGVTVGGVDVGGLEEQEAKALLRHELVAPLQRPIKVAFKDRRFTLPAKRLQVRANVDAMVEEAIEVSQEGGLPGRVVRYVTGGTVDKAIAPQVSYSSKAISRFIERVSDTLYLDPQNASIEPSTTDLAPVPSKNGRKLRATMLRAALHRVVDRNGGSRLVRAAVRPLKAEVTTAELAEQYPVYLTLDRYGFTLRLFKDLDLVEEYPVAVGTVGFETPVGLYNIQNKAVDPAWSVPEWGGSLAGQVIPGGTAENPLKERWLGIYDGAGIHGTDQTWSLGTAASHGCVRMSIPDVIELYDQVPVGTPIYIG